MAAPPVRWAASELRSDGPARRRRVGSRVAPPSQPAAGSLARFAVAVSRSPARSRRWTSTGEVAPGAVPSTVSAVGSFAGPRSLRQLLDAVQIVASDLDLPTMLRSITQAAVDLVDARYGALGVLDASKTRLAQFITIGIDDDGRRAIGHLPEGHGILGLLIVEARPLRLPDLSEHPEQLRLPARPPADDVVPGRADPGARRGLRQPLPHRQALGEVFTDVDEELVVGLAGAAGVAIENARLSRAGARRSPSPRTASASPATSTTP